MSGALSPEAAQSGSQVTAFLDFCRLEKGLATNSIEAYSADLSRFIAFIGGIQETPAAEGLRRYLDHLYSAGLGTRSVARHLSTLRSFYGFLLREALVTQDPTENLGAPKTWQTIP